MVQILASMRFCDNNFQLARIRDLNNIFLDKLFSIDHSIVLTRCMYCTIFYKNVCLDFRLCRLNIEYFKDGAYFCYCVNVLRISRYSGFLWVVPTNTGICLAGFKLCGECRTKQVLLVVIIHTTISRHCP